MSKNFFRITLLFSLVLTLTANNFGQTLICKKQALTALKPIPKLKYQCTADVNDYDESILQLPQRRSAIKRYLKSLESYYSESWWKTGVLDLNVCDYRRKSGKLTVEQKNEFERGVYIPDLFGNPQIRVIRATDPCYQTGFGGSNIYLLHRKNGKVFTSEIIDGYFSRADAIFVDFALNGNEQIIEVATSSGGFNPTITNYYFTIDRKTGRAVPKNLFLGENKKLTNQITSMMLLENSEEYDLPPNVEPLNIIKNGRLVKSFDKVIETYETIGQDNHQKFDKITLRWNGKYYQ
jgi:hypothetical protein